MDGDAGPENYSARGPRGIGGFQGFQGFQYTATNLQDYVECPRLFQLRHVEGLRWPAPQAEPVAEAERSARMGRDFHRLAHQFALGIPPSELEASITEPELAAWWRNFTAHPPPGLGEAERTWPEVTVSAPFSERRLLARYDLLALLPGGRFLILDWKTYHRRPSRPQLARKVQTRLYPLLMVEAGAGFTGGNPVGPGDVTFSCWFTAYPSAPESFPYDESSYRADGEFLLGLIREIESRDPAAGWEKTPREARCAYCNYRSLCERGERAGSVEGLEEDFAEFDDGVSLDWGDWGQIKEIQY